MPPLQLIRRSRPCLVYLGTVVIALTAALWPVRCVAGEAASAPASLGLSIAQSRCAACHGVDGNSLDPANPKLAGQLEGFLVLQLRNYKSGERPHPVMATMAKPLSERDIQALARHYSAQAPMRHDGAADPALLRRGETVFKVGKPGAPACQYCHGAAGQGVAPVFARLAGQHPEFIVASLRPYRKESKFGNPYAHVMKAVVQEWSDDDIRAVAAYVGALR